MAIQDAHPGKAKAVETDLVDREEEGRMEMCDLLHQKKEVGYLKYSNVVSPIAWSYIWQKSQS